jgi:hypothetical protein
MSQQRLSNRQIQALKHLAICCANGGQVTLTRDQREAMVPLWHRELIEIWYRSIPGERQRGPFFRPTEFGWQLISAVLAAPQRMAAAA